MDNVPKTEEIISGFIHKLAQVIVLTRVCTEPTKSTNRWFNLALPHSPRVRDRVSALCEGPNNRPDLQIDVMLSAPTFPAPILLERWNIHHDSEAQLQSSRKFDPANMYKRMIILVRSVYSCVHMLPAFQLFKAARASATESHPFQIDCFFSSQGQRTEVFESTPSNFVFSSLTLDHGKMHTSVFYRKDCSFEFPGTKPSMLNPSIIPNFFDSSAVHAGDGENSQLRDRQRSRGSSTTELPIHFMQELSEQPPGRGSISMSDRQDGYSRSMIAEERKSISEEATFPVSRSQAISIPTSSLINTTSPPFAHSFDSQSSFYGSVPSSFSRRATLFNHSPEESFTPPARHASPRPLGVPMPILRPPSFSLDAYDIDPRQMSLRNRVDRKPPLRTGQRIAEEQAGDDPEAVLGEFVSRMNAMPTLTNFLASDGFPRRVALSTLVAEAKRLSRPVRNASEPV